MSWALNNIVAPDAYNASATLEGLPALDHVNLDVAGQAVYWSVKLARLTSDVSGTWEPEVFMLPSSRTLRRRGMVGIRVRAAVPALQLPGGATPARVTIEAVEA